ncbi:MULTISPECIES: S66 peptidase family protein [unclassified Exiguobacterium]|uniref:S66 family peptidase n=1 Tax=unclassified Exiguobacterium TaxID=2644629 RepID=UPI00103D03C1|nr:MULTISPECIES: S66 peptidase family protein [unclassified Exiguobacterium]TCI60607.1 LD-carboxypeptidase [Exiguobacterium sp. SH0S2]
MIRYPQLTGRHVGVTAPSSGVPAARHSLLHDAETTFARHGFTLQFEPSVWTQHKAKSAPAAVRAEEMTRLFHDEDVDLIIPPWGGVLLLELLDKIAWDTLPAKWMLGYSDVSLFLFVYTLKTGIASAHGTNLVDLRGESWDATSSRWLDVLSTKHGETVIQLSSEQFQKEWQHGNPSPCVYHLTEPTVWKSLGGMEATGRLLGGCIDVLLHTIGTPYGDVAQFQQTHLNDEPILWYFENAEMDVPALKRTLLQMKWAGWFDHTTGILFGRSDAQPPVQGYTAEDVYAELQELLNVPIIYDIDCGHVPPQLTLINGAHASIQVEDGKGTLIQTFKG